MKNICVFCGASSGNDDKYIELAATVGELLGQSGHRMIYGGGKVGLMGAAADACLQSGGEVIGVIPKNLVSQEVAHFKVTLLHVVENMHERKKMMYDNSDAFLVLPGGMGTLDEMFEILTWAQLKLHNKPVYILNETGFFTHLIQYLQHASDEGFIRKEHLQLFKVLTKVEDVKNL